MVLRIILWGVFAGLPLFLLSSCVYLYHSPHLLLDPITRAIVTSEDHPAGWWRTVDVELVPTMLEPGLNLIEVNARLWQAGFFLGNDELMSRQYRQSELENGYTHTFTRNGRARIACGETLFVRVGMQDGALVKATASGRWTCL
ncbi:MAG: hypothetical protein ABS76_23360 [Pelagibacterium sp. SCN 64-44]|nr:MAG: hypothetical protein ABS76_23360 [Pelagibacterium sp. SCN 64-44]